jgi:hypothetical protein
MLKVKARAVPPAIAHKAAAAGDGEGLMQLGLSKCSMRVSDSVEVSSLELLLYCTISNKLLMLYALCSARSRLNGPHHSVIPR